MKRIIIFLSITINIVSCDLNLEPISSVTKEPIFASENGLKLYTNSFYDILPSVYSAHSMDNMTDYSVRTDVPDFIRPGTYSSQQSTGWSWHELRNINYFIVNCKESPLPQPIIENYLGISRFFRAYFYFEKVVRFGDVPWINKPLSENDSSLYAPRDSRTVIMDSVLADLDYACSHINDVKDPTSSLVTKSVALALKSRICLFEGTFRKYHTSYGLQNTALKWLKEAENAAKKVMDDNKYEIYKSNIDTSYRTLFTSKKAVETEVILASVCDAALAVTNDANWWWTSATYGLRISLSRDFVNTYLKIDGTPFTNTPNYEKMIFPEETKDRDLRLKQTIRTPGYKRTDGDSIIAAAPLFSYTYTGYHPIKFCLDDLYYDSGANNDNTIPLIRYAEVLLNFAEAKAEMGTLTDEDWLNTIGILRDRAGITGGLASKPTFIDPYLQSNYFPEINDPAILEIRRERAIELVFEGLRLKDLIRWRKGNLIEKRWTGMYVPKLDSPMDLDEDGKPDVCFTFKENIDNPVSGVIYVNVSPTMKDGMPNPQILTEKDKGELLWLDNISRKWEEKHYLYPIPKMSRIINSNLSQNPGW